MRTKITRALLSVYDKTGIVEFARELQRARRRAGVARRDRHGHRRRRHPGHRRRRHHRRPAHPRPPGGHAPPEDPRRDPGRPRRSRRTTSDMATYGIQPFDLVVSNLYPFARRPRHRDDRHRRPGDGAGGGEEPRVRHRRHRPVAVRAGARGAATPTTTRWATTPAASSPSPRSPAPRRTTPRSSPGCSDDDDAARSTSTSRSSAPARPCATARTRTSTARATASPAPRAGGTTSSSTAASRSRYLNLYDADAAWRLVHDLHSTGAADGPRSPSSSTPTRAASRWPTTSPPPTSARSSATSGPRSAASSR